MRPRWLPPKSRTPLGAITIDEYGLLSRLRAGDESAFRQLLSDFGPPMLRVAGAYAPDSQAASEIVQETWIAVLRGLESFEGRSSLRTWVFTILRNCARRRAKMEARSAPLTSLASREGRANCIRSSPRTIHDGRFAGPRSMRAGTRFPRMRSLPKTPSERSWRC